MSEALNIIKAAFGGLREVTTAPLWQYDYGQILQITGLDLPQVFEVHFSNSRKSGETITQIGGDNQVTIPDMYLTSGADIYCFIFLHDGLTDGETEYVIKIPVRERPEPSDIAPTPEQQDAITEAIAVLNDAVEQTGEDKAATAALAEAAAASSLVATEAAQSAQGSATAASASATTATNAASTATQKASEAATSATNAANAKTAAETAQGDAEGAAIRAELAAASIVPVDPTLKIAGRAADAKATGDRLDALTETVSGKQNTLTFDDAPTSGSVNPVKSGGVYAAVDAKVSKPLTNPMGTNGQLLRTLGNGQTEWVDQGLPTDEQTAQAVSDWLDDHPEATTTVEDGAVTWAKLNSAVQNEIDGKAPAIYATETGVSNSLTGSEIGLSISGPMNHSLSLFNGDDIIYPNAKKVYYTYGTTGISYVAPNMIAINSQFSGEKNFALSSTGNAWDITLDTPIPANSVIKFRMYWMAGVCTGQMPKFSIYVNSGYVKYNLAFNEDTKMIAYDYTCPSDVTKIRIFGTLYSGSVLTDAVIGFVCTVASDEIVIPSFDATTYPVSMQSLSGWNKVCSMPKENTITTVTDTKTYVDNHIPTDVLTKETFPVATPEMFGAVGDGITDDTVAFNTAIQYAETYKIPFVAGKAYNITSRIELNGNKNYYFIRYITCNVADYAMRYRGQQSFVNVVAIYNTGGGGILIAPQDNSETRTNDFNFGWIYAYASGYDALRITSSANGLGIYYNVFHILQLYSRKGNALYGCYGYGENKFYGGKLSAPEGWAIYLDHCGFNKYWGFTMEGDCFAGIYLNDSDHCEFHAIRDIELIMHRDDGVSEGTLRGMALKFMGESYANLYENADTMYFEAIDISGLTKLSQYKDISGYRIVKTAQRNILRTADLVRTIHQIVTTPTGYLLPNNRLAIKELWIAPERVISKRPYKCNLTVAENADMTTNARLIWATYLDMAANASVKLHETYCSEGFDEVVIEQKESAKAVVYDHNGILLFDGTNYGAGSYTLSAINAPDEVYLGKNAETENPLPCGWNDGENDIWYAKRSGILLEKTHLAKHYLNSGETITFRTSTSEPIWSSSNSAVASVSNGVVSAVALGVSTITATGNDTIERWVITVV